MIDLYHHTKDQALSIITHIGIRIYHHTYIDAYIPVLLNPFEALHSLSAVH